jgi:glycogen debranching enzyme/glycosyltransferase involved in cell wall biosynthesis
MKIAQISSLYEAVPPKLYGGTERVVHYLTEGLMTHGQEVTLFASGDSRTTARLVSHVPEALRLNKSVQDPLAHHIIQMREVAELAEEFDILHFHTDYLHYPFSSNLRIPAVTTLHGRLDIPDLKLIYEKFKDQPVVSISNSQRKPLPHANWQGTVYHGLPENLFSKGNGSGGYLAFLGRISPEKRPDRAIEIAKRTGIKLKIAAKIDDADRDYFHNQIGPMMDHPLVEYIGEINETEKNYFLGDAIAMLFPIDWSEPFGMVLIEAMACGTPVIAFNAGSVPEIIADGENGYIVESVDQAVEAVNCLHKLNRDIVRGIFERRFTDTIMVDNYLELYEKLIRKKMIPVDQARNNHEDIHHNNKYVISADSTYDTDGFQVLNHGHTFGIFDRWGDIQPVGKRIHGIYNNDTRFINRLELRLNHYRPLLLSSNMKRENEILSVDLTNPEVICEKNGIIHHGNIHIGRNQFVWEDVYQERIEVSNFSPLKKDLLLTMRFEGDFSDIFEIRGLKRDKRGRHLGYNFNGSREFSIGYEGLDDVVRSAEISFSTDFEVIDEKKGLIGFRMDLDPQRIDFIDYSIHFYENGKIKSKRDFDAIRQLISPQLERNRSYFASITSSNEEFDHWINRSLSDLISLMADTPRGVYPFAGVPWYNTAFGRDGIITAFETLWIAPGLARDVLLYLADCQAETEDPYSDAEPGKILHETRGGEMVALREVPFRQYYGTVDATPLFVMLAGEYFDRTADMELISSIWPNILKAINWIDMYGDIDKDGFVEYQHKSVNGLANQGWKDSHDSIFHKNGEFAKPPVALCEVQGYVYAAKMHAASIARSLGHPEKEKKWQMEAAELKVNFNKKFWDREMNCYAMALDGDKKPCKVVSSNAGQTLFTGIADKDKAAKIVRRMLSPDMFSGWGIRTLSTREARYNPMSYHNGSVWPHDVALIAKGMAEYGFQRQAAKLLESLFEASLYTNLQTLPELFCGFGKREDEGPTAYPVACSPQAWSVAAVFMMINASLNMKISHRKKRIIFRQPVLPACLNNLEIRDLPLGKSSVDIEIMRYKEGDMVGVNLKRNPEKWELLVLK